MVHEIKQKLYFFFPIFILSLYTVLGQQEFKVLKRLDTVLDRQDEYIQKKYMRISKLKSNIESIQLKEDDEVLYTGYLTLFNEYRSFKYDSAYYFLDKAKVVAKEIGNHTLITEIKINEGFILLSSGLFKEALDILDAIPEDDISESNRYSYYLTQARAYYDLADYNNDRRFKVNYIKKGSGFLKKAMEISVPGSSEYLAAKGLMNLKQHNWAEAEKAFTDWIAKRDLKPEQYGIATSSLSYIYAQLGNLDKAIETITLAAISDVKNATKENIALRNLARLLYEQGFLEKSNRYMHLAMEDATFYNARHRKIQISSILPIIEGAQLLEAQKKNTHLTIIVFALAILILAVIIFLIIIIKQLQHKNNARKVLSEYTVRLEEMNVNLLEADAIKQDYITYFLKATSDLIKKLGNIQKSTMQKIKTKQPEEVLTVLKRYSVKKERQNLFHQFDQVFLKLFPSFIKEFNNLFPESERKVLKKEEILNTELRIYALYRLGIQNSQQVAEFLEISVATIYTYKTRLKTKSIFKDSFEEKIMAIKRL